MVFPVADDNSDRTLFPLVTVALIVLNVFVFVVLQGMGQNDDVTLAYCQVPAEILSGRDVVTEPSMREIAVQGQQVVVPVPGLRPTPIPARSPGWKSKHAYAQRPRPDSPTRRKAVTVASAPSTDNSARRRKGACTHAHVHRP